MVIDNKILGVAIASLLVGGGAVAAYHAAQKDAPAAFQPVSALQPADAGNRGPLGSEQPDAGAQPLSFASVSAAQRAPIIAVNRVTRDSRQYGTVLEVDPVRRTVAQNTPRQECRDVVVQQRLPERDGNVGGTVAGAVIGGLAGNQLGKNKSSDRRKIETVAGAVGGGFLGRYIDQRHVGGRVVNTTQRQCNTVMQNGSREVVAGYDVTVRNPDGSVSMQRMKQRPGSRIALGSQKETVGYDVTYLLDGQERVVRLDERPMVKAFPVVDGRVVTAGG